MITANSKKMAKVIAKAWTDPAYKKRLIKEPAKVLKEEGIKTPKGAKIHVHENSPKALHLVLPQRPDSALAQDAVHENAGGHGVHTLLTCSS